MAKTNAILNVVPEASLGNKGLVVTVKKDDDIFGHLMVGKASLVWFEKHAKSKGRKFAWDDFHKWVMQRDESCAKRPSIK